MFSASDVDGLIRTLTRRKSIAGYGPGQRRADPIGHDHARHPVQSQAGCDRTQHGSRVVDLLQHAVAQDDVGAGRIHQVRHLIAVALERGDRIGDSGVLSAPGQS